MKLCEKKPDVLVFPGHLQVIEKAGLAYQQYAP